jgi:hypothetical protein
MNINNFYISGNLSSDGRINTNSQSWLGTARCKDCKNGNFQDPQNFCNQTDPGTCIASGFLCNSISQNKCNPGFSPNAIIDYMHTSCNCSCGIF